jgi:hypothetical protein
MKFRNKKKFRYGIPVYTGPFRALVYSRNYGPSVYAVNSRTSCFSLYYFKWRSRVCFRTTFLSILPSVSQVRSAKFSFKSQHTLYFFLYSDNFFGKCQTEVAGRLSISCYYDMHTVCLANFIEVFLTSAANSLSLCRSTSCLFIPLLPSTHLFCSEKQRYFAIILQA